MERGNVAEATEVFRRAYATDNGNSDQIRDNLRLALARLDAPVYEEFNQDVNFELVYQASDTIDPLEPL